MTAPSPTKTKLKLPPIGKELWSRANNAVTSIHFVKKSGRETWRTIVDDDNGWGLPPEVCFYTSAAHKPSAEVGAGASGDSGTWIKRRVILQGARLLAACGPSKKSQRVLVDLRDVRGITLGSSSVHATIDGILEVLFPWQLDFEWGVTLRVASQLPRDALLWTSAIQKLSGASIRGDDGDFQNPAEARRLGTEYASNDLGLAADIAALKTHAAFTYVDGHYAGGFEKDKWEGYGRLTLSTGDVYEGHFQDGLRHGRGVLRYASGSIYNGFFAHGLRHGEGSYYDVRGLGANRAPMETGLHDGFTQQRVNKGQGISETHLQLAWQFPKAVIFHMSCLYISNILRII